MLKKSHLTRDILQTLVLIGSLRLVLSFSHGLMTQILLQQMFGTAGYRIVVIVVLVLRVDGPFGLHVRL